MGKKAQRTDDNDRLQGWSEIAHFLGQPVATAHRWAKTGMPVKREGRYTLASREQLRTWLGKESHASQPLHIPAKGEELADELRRSLQAARGRNRRSTS